MKLPCNADLMHLAIFENYLFAKMELLRVNFGIVYLVST